MNGFYHRKILGDLSDPLKKFNFLQIKKNPKFQNLAQIFQFFPIINSHSQLNELIKNLKLQSCSKYWIEYLYPLEDEERF